MLFYNNANAQILSTLFTTAMVSVKKLIKKTRIVFDILNCNTAF